MAGRHISVNANTLMRNPAWNEGKRACTLTMHPADADALKLVDGQSVRITTEAGSELVELEVTGTACKGQVTIPHGFGLVYEGKAFRGKRKPLDKKHQQGPSRHANAPVCTMPGGKSGEG